jgi:hypothetical protein
MTFTPIAELPAPAECVMRKTFDELVDYSLRIPMFNELFTTATTWGGQDYTSGHGWAMRDHFQRGNDFDAELASRGKDPWFYGGCYYPMPHMVASREADWARQQRGEERDRFHLDRWWYFPERMTIERTKGFRDATRTKKGVAVPARVRRFREAMSNAEYKRKGQASYNPTNNYPTRACSSFYQSGWAECSTPDWTDREGNPIQRNRKVYGDGGVSEVAHEQTDVRYSEFITRRYRDELGYEIYHDTLYDILETSNYIRRNAYSVALGGKNPKKRFPAEKYPIHPHSRQAHLRADANGEYDSE